MKVSSSNTAKKTATNPDDSDNNTLFVELFMWKESYKTTSSYQADLDFYGHAPVTQKDLYRRA